MNPGRPTRLFRTPVRPVPVAPRGLDLGSAAPEPPLFTPVVETAESGLPALNAGSTEPRASAAGAGPHLRRSGRPLPTDSIAHVPPI